MTSARRGSEIDRPATPSTIFKTTAVVATGSARTIGGALTRQADTTAATQQTSNRRINVRVG